MYYSLVSPQVAELLAVARRILTEVLAEAGGAARRPARRDAQLRRRRDRSSWHGRRCRHGPDPQDRWQTGRVAEPAPPPATALPQAAGWRGSVQVRHVDAGSCNGCEIEIGQAFSPVYDAERYGVRLVASPRHADVLTVTGPVTVNMADAAAQDLRGDARAAAGRGGRRLRPRLRGVRRRPRGGGPVVRCGSGGCARARLPAGTGGDRGRAARADRPVNLVGERRWSPRCGLAVAARCAGAVRAAAGGGPRSSAC